MTKQMLFYESAVPISAKRHREWSIEPPAEFRFATGCSVVPLAAIEFPPAVVEYVIAFIGSKGARSPAAILGIKPNDNLYLDENGNWSARYIPAFVRRYPFVFAMNKENNRLMLCIDENYAGWNQEGRGERLFDGNGQQTEYLKDILAFLEDYQRRSQRTLAFCRKLDELHLLEPMQARLKLPSGESAGLRGFTVVNREKLNALSGEQLSALVKSGALELIYLHLQSMRNLATVIRRVPEAFMVEETTRAGDSSKIDVVSEVGVDSRENPTPVRMTLRDYLQQRWKVPTEEQLILINNSHFSKRFTYCLPGKHNREASTPLAIPNQSCVLFMGNLDSSSDTLEQLPYIYKLIAEKSHARYKLVLGKGDYIFRHSNTLGMPDNLLYLLANNVTIEHARIGYLPMGRDFRSASVFSAVLPTERKTTLCYCNFSVNTHPVRQLVHESLRDKPFVQFEHMGRFRRYSISRALFFQQLTSSKFAVCPRGNGIDTFRLWDCLYCGVIPIVVREAQFHRQLQDLPILFLDSYSDFRELTLERLEGTYDAMLDRHYNYSKLILSTWLNQFGQLNQFDA